MPLTLAIEMAFVWIVVFMSFSKVSDSEWILNLAAPCSRWASPCRWAVLGIWYA